MAPTSHRPRHGPIRRVWEERALKHRTPGHVRPVPEHPELVAALSRHIEHYSPGNDGRLFVTRTGKAGIPLPPPYVNPIAMGSVYRAWQKARIRVLTPDQAASSLARRPYDLRHACLSTWLNAGVPPAQVAEWAGSQRPGTSPGLREVSRRPGRTSTQKDRSRPRLTPEVLQTSERIPSAFRADNRRSSITTGHHRTAPKGPQTAFPQVRGSFRVWQVQDSNLRRYTPTDLQSAPIGRSGNLPCCAARPSGGQRQRKNSAALPRDLKSPRRGATTWPTRRSTSSARSTGRRSTTRSARRPREIATRFDFKGTGATIEWQGDHAIEISASADDRATRRARRVQGQADQAAAEPEDPRRRRAAPVRPRARRSSIALKEGITSEDAKKIAKLIRDEGPKGVKAQIQGDELRVSQQEARRPPGRAARW